MELSVGKIAELLKGEVVGDVDFIIRGVAPFDEASAHDVTFATSAKYMRRIDETGAGAVIVPLAVRQSKKVLVRVENPYLALAKVSTLFHTPPRPVVGISQEASVGNNFRCGKEISAYPGVFIGDDVTVGDRVTLDPGVVVGNGAVSYTHLRAHET